METKESPRGQELQAGGDCSARVQHRCSWKGRIGRSEGGYRSSRATLNVKAAIINTRERRDQHEQYLLDILWEKFKKANPTSLLLLSLASLSSFSYQLARLTCSRLVLFFPPRAEIPRDFRSRASVFAYRCVQAGASTHDERVYVCRGERGRAGGSLIIRADVLQRQRSCLHCARNFDSRTRENIDVPAIFPAATVIRQDLSDV